MSLTKPSTYSTTPSDSKIAYVNELFSQVCRENGGDPEKLLEKLKTNTLLNVIEEFIYDFEGNPVENSYIAGALLMREQYLRSPLTTKEYVSVFRNKLIPEVRSTMVEFAEVFDGLLKDRYIRDFRKVYFAASVTIKTYLSRLSYDQEPLEIPQMMWLRIACGLFYNDTLEDIIELYEAYSSEKGVPATPTILNTGNKKGAPTSCMIMTVEDDLKDMFDVLTEVAMAEKSNAGVGVDLSNLRVSAIGTSGVSQGIIPYCKTMHGTANLVNQGGVRPGAIAVTLRDCHFDLDDFIDIVDPSADERVRCYRLNTSIILSDVFMERLRDGGDFTTFCPKHTPKLKETYGEEFKKHYIEYERQYDEWVAYQECIRKGQTWEKEVPRKIVARRMAASYYIQKIAYSQIRTGMPYIIHGCNVNRKNNMDNVGNVRGPNLCQEIMIPAIPKKETGCCNLASLSLKAFVINGEFDFEAFGKYVRIFVRALNRVVDESMSRISDKARASNERSRPIGLGVSGFGNCVNKLDIPITDMNDPSYVPDYSDATLKKRKINPKLKEFNRKLWSCMYYNALIASMEESKQFGPYPEFWSSHTAKGELQFDLYAEEQKHMGRSGVDPTPVDPSEWGQEGSWDSLKKDISMYGLRNALMLTIMPTASSASILNNSESVEFLSYLFYVRKLNTGEYPIINHDMVKDFRDLGIWNRNTSNNIVYDNEGSILGVSEEGLSPEKVQRLRHLKEKYLTMYEVPQKIMIDLAADRQPFIDHSQSMNIYIRAPTPDVLSKIHYYTWTKGLKTGMYYLRSRSHNRVIKISYSHDKDEVEKRDIEALPSCNIDGGECLSCQ